MRPPAERFAGRSGPLRVLVVGGSLGAQALNEIVAAGAWPARPRAHCRRSSIRPATKHIEALQADYAAAGVQAHCVPFIEDMAGAYAWADVVICRAGALTVAELAAAGVASILVPFPHAVDDHQTGNARFLVNVGGGLPVAANRTDAGTPSPR